MTSPATVLSKAPHVLVQEEWRNQANCWGRSTTHPSWHPKISATQPKSHRVNKAVASAKTISSFPGGNQNSSRTGKIVRTLEKREQAVKRARRNLLLIRKNYLQYWNVFSLQRSKNRREKYHQTGLYICLTKQKPKQTIRDDWTNSVFKSHFG